MVHEIKSLIEIYDGKKIDRAKQETEEEKWDFDEKFDVFQKHEGDKDDGDDAKYNQRGREVEGRKKINQDDHCPESECGGNE